MPGPLELERHTLDQAAALARMEHEYRDVVVLPGGALRDAACVRLDCHWKPELMVVKVRNESLLAVSTDGRVTAACKLT